MCRYDAALFHYTYMYIPRSYPVLPRVERRVDVHTCDATFFPTLEETHFRERKESAEVSTLVFSSLQDSSPYQCSLSLSLCSLYSLLLLHDKPLHELCGAFFFTPPSSPSITFISGG